MNGRRFHAAVLSILLLGAGLTACGGGGSGSSSSGSGGNGGGGSTPTSHTIGGKHQWACSTVPRPCLSLMAGPHRR